MDVASVASASAAQEGFKDWEADLGAATALTEVTQEPVEFVTAIKGILQDSGEQQASVGVVWPPGSATAPTRPNKHKVHDEASRCNRLRLEWDPTARLRSRDDSDDQHLIRSLQRLEVTPSSARFSVPPPLHPASMVSRFPAFPRRSAVMGMSPRWLGSDSRCPWPVPATRRSTEVGLRRRLGDPFGGPGARSGELNSPHGFCCGNADEIVVADTNNHRIQVFSLEGSSVFCFGLPGKEDGCLYFPRKVAVLNSGQYVVCDRGSWRSRMQIFSPTGHFLARIVIQPVNIVAGIAVLSNDNIAIVDSVTPTIFVYSPVSGELVHGFECKEHMLEPSDLSYWKTEFYVCDFKGHGVVVFSYAGLFLRRIDTRLITRFPNGVDVSDDGDVVVVDTHGNQLHLAVFARHGALTADFCCSHIQVSRCSGLKIMRDGSIATVAKNNHNVLVIDALYIPQHI